MNAEIGVGFIGAGDIFTYHASGIKKCAGANAIVAQRIIEGIEQSIGEGRTISLNQKISTP